MELDSLKKPNRSGDFHGANRGAVRRPLQRPPAAPVPPPTTTRPRQAGRRAAQQHHVRFDDGDVITAKSVIIGCRLPDDGLAAAGQGPALGNCGFGPARIDLFAVGDVRSGSVKRAATAIGEGSMAVRLVFERLQATGSAVADPPRADGTGRRADPSGGDTRRFP